MRPIRRILKNIKRQALLKSGLLASTADPGAPRIGTVDFGDLRRAVPISAHYGFDRGLSVDRYYIEKFLAGHTSDIRGSVLEMADANYTRRFGGARVDSSDVLHLTPDNSKATLVGDLSRADFIPGERFDCVILTQTLPFIPDVPAALRHLHRIMRPGGTLLATFPGISQMSAGDAARWGDYWRFTRFSAKLLFEASFPGADTQIESHGNVLAAVAVLHGLSVEDLPEKELLDAPDPNYEVIITVRATRANFPRESS